MIHIKLEDNIIDIIEKIEKENQEEIILLFPIGHPIIHNYISLKILKTKTTGKKIKIITQDSIGRKICKSVGFNIEKQSHSGDHQNPSRIIEYNYSSLEYIKYLLKQYKNELIQFIFASKKINQFSKYGKYDSKTYGIIFFFSSFSILIFILVYYLAISKTLVVISPETVIKKEALNFYLDTQSESSVLGNNNIIKLSKISENFTLKQNFSATDIRYTSQSVSHGKIQIFNKSDESISLKPDTRFQDPNGLIFRLKNWIEIPAGTIDNFGEISPGISEVEIYADIKDVEGGLIGEKGNISGGVELFLPGLDIEERKEIYAKTLSAFTGGTNSFTRHISQKDIDDTKNLFIDILKKGAYEHLKQKINKDNITNSTKIDILSLGDYISYSDINVQLEDGVKAGDQKDSFSYSGSINITAYSYNKENILQKLKTLINEKNIEGIEKIKNINEDSLRLAEVISNDAEHGKIKATYEIEALNYYNIIDQESYIKTLKQKIKGLPRITAENILINDPKISKASITIRPFFIYKVSSLIGNIDIKVEL